MADDHSTRRCKACGDVKPMGEFHPNPDKNYKCAPCLKEYKRQFYLRHREAIIGRTRDSYYADLEASRAKGRKRAKVDPKARERKDAYKVRHRDRVLSQAKQYRELNREACNARVADWGARNKHIRALWAAQRRAATLKATPAWADAEAIEAVYLDAQRQSETGEMHEVDHIVPLRGKTVCGLHSEANLRVVPWVENRSKGSRHWPDMW